MAFAKDLDTVDHQILLAKLGAYEVTGRLHSWFTDYLGGWMQRVVIEVTSGVRKGSPLGRLLFTIFINDHPEETVDAVIVALCAKDTKVYCSIKSNRLFNANLDKYLSEKEIKSPFRFSGDSINNPADLLSDYLVRNATRNHTLSPRV